MKLGKREIDALTCPPHQQDRLVFDDDCPGLGLRVTRDGAKVFVYQYRFGTLTRRLRLGHYGTEPDGRDGLTLMAARKLVIEARGSVAAGRDPAAERKAARAKEAAEAGERRRKSEANALTFAALVDLWEAKQLAHRSARYRTEAVRALRTSLSAMLDAPAHSIDAATVRRVLDSIPRRRKPSAAEAAARKAEGGNPRGKDTSPLPAKRGEAMARRVRAYGAAMYGWAVKRELVPGNPFAGIAIESREVRRDRVLNDGELGEVWRAVAGLGWPWASYLAVLMLTLQREAEVAGMAWAELSPDLSTWELPAARTKNGKPHTVHLAEPTRALLRAVPRAPGARLVFSTTGRTAISGFSHAKVRLDLAIAKARAAAAAEAGRKPEAMPPWRLHDFRRTGVTALVRKGVRWEVADKLLNHVAGAISGVAAIYQRHDFLAERAAALDAWAAHVLAVGEANKPGGNVVELRRG
jgi:hypothetical protein